MQNTNLKNNLMGQSICNGTIGIVTNINLLFLEVRIVFSVIRGVVDVRIKRESVTFIVDEKLLSRYQFLLQNAFALTVHKTQFNLVRSLLMFQSADFFTG